MVKKTKRKGFNFFRSYYDVYNELSDKDKVSFMDALLDRQFLGVKPSGLEGMAKFAYISQTNSIDSQVKGYEDKTGKKLTPENYPTEGGRQGATEGGRQGGCRPPAEQVQVQEKEKEKGKEKVQYSLECVKCYQEVLKYFPNHLHPKSEKIMNTWLDTIDKLNRLDKIPFESIARITKITREDDFWNQHFLSLVKLRKKNKDKVPYIVVFHESLKNKHNETRNFNNEQQLAESANRVAANLRK